MCSFGGAANVCKGVQAQRISSRGTGAERRVCMAGRVRPEVPECKPVRQICTPLQEKYRSFHRGTVGGTVFLAIDDSGTGTKTSDEEYGLHRSGGTAWARDPFTCQDDQSRNDIDTQPCQLREVARTANANRRDERTQRYVETESAWNRRTCST